MDLLGINGLGAAAGKYGFLLQLQRKKGFDSKNEENITLEIYMENEIVEDVFEERDLAVFSERFVFKLNTTIPVFSKWFEQYISNLRETKKQFKHFWQDSVFIIGGSKFTFSKRMDQVHFVIIGQWFEENNPEVNNEGVGEDDRKNEAQSFDDDAFLAAEYITVHGQQEESLLSVVVSFEDHLDSMNDVFSRILTDITNEFQLIPSNNYPEDEREWDDLNLPPGSKINEMEKELLRMWRKKYTAVDIGKSMSITSGTVLNIVTDLRKRFNETIVPYHRK